MKVQLKRIYDDVETGDGYRVLIDRIWPRGMTKEAAGLDVWARDIAPSTELRKWYNHDPARTDEFQARYEDELAHNNNTLADLQSQVQGQTVVTLLTSTKDLNLSHGQVLKTKLS